MLFRPAIKQGCEPQIQAERRALPQAEEKKLLGQSSTGFVPIAGKRAKLTLGGARSKGPANAAGDVVRTVQRLGIPHPGGHVLNLLAGPGQIARRNACDNRQPCD